MSTQWKRNWHKDFEPSGCRFGIMNPSFKLEWGHRHETLQHSPRGRIWLGWIPGILGFFNSAKDSWIWIAQIVDPQKSFKMKPNSNKIPANSTLKIHFLTFVRAFIYIYIIIINIILDIPGLGRWTWCDKRFIRKFHIFWYQFHGRRRTPKKDMNEKLPKNEFYGSWNCVGWRKIK